jgi:geranylgeranyl diphosphate synthase, type I
MGLMSTSGVDISDFNQRLEEELLRVVDVAARGPRVWAEAVDCAADLIRAGGKRVRPRLCLLSFLASGGEEVDYGLVRFAAGIELLHTCMLVQDDVMDRSTMRRSVVTVHHAILERGLLREARLAEGIAVVVGDVLATLATEQFVAEELDLTRARAAAAVVHRAMRETAAGQILDLGFGDREIDDVDEGEILLAYRLKTAYFAFEAPLRSGAILAGASERVCDALAEFGLGLGTAFQLRDDLIGFLGDQSLTGKRAVDDLREGKKTLLLRLLWERSGAADRHLLGALIGRRDPSEAELRRLRELAHSTGAVEDVERKITDLSRAAAAALFSVELVEQWRNHLQLFAHWLERRDA